MIGKQQMNGIGIAMGHCLDKTTLWHKTVYIRSKTTTKQKNKNGKSHVFAHISVFIRTVIYFIQHWQHFPGMLFFSPFSLILLKTIIFQVEINHFNTAHWSF